MRAVLLLICIELCLVCLSGASPRVCEVSWEPDAGALATTGCPSGSCQDHRRPC